MRVVEYGAPIKTLDAKLWWISLLNNPLCILSHIISERKRNMLSIIPLGEGNWKLHLWNFPELGSMHHFPWLIFTVSFSCNELATLTRIAFSEPYEFS